MFKHTGKDCLSQAQNVKAQDSKARVVTGNELHKT